LRLSEPVKLPEIADRWSILISMGFVKANRDRLIEMFVELALQNTPPRQELAASELAKARLEALGFDCFYDNAGIKVGGNVGNLIAYKKGNVPTAPPIFFSAHFDTVEPTPGLVPIVDGDTIKSDGKTIVGADDKCGVAAILEGMYLLQENNLKYGDIQLLLTICEEIGLVGAKHMEPTDIKAKYGFVLDSGPPIGSAIYQAPTQDIFDVYLTGRPAHAGAQPEEGISAIRIAADAISKMKLGRIDAETTANVGIIQGGNATNIITENVYLKCEARSRDIAKLDHQREHMITLFQDAAKDAGGQCRVELYRAYEGYELAMDDPTLLIVEQAAEAAGLEFVLRVTGGGADANVFNKFGIPTTVLACGMQHIHTHDEYVLISDMIKSAELVVAIAETAADFKA
jgi:tripeptide aminopeptidase